MVSILFLSADPTNATRLRLGEEAREIEEKLRLSRHRDNFELETKWSARPHDISQALLDLNPQIVHFSGHGSPDGSLCVENVNGKVQAISPDALASLFENFADVVQCVILNACFSIQQAEAVSRHIPYVIGMSREVGDRASIAFAIGFYQALGAGRSIDQAFKLGVVAIRMQGIAEHLTPVLIKDHDLSGIGRVSSPETAPVTPARRDTRGWEEREPEPARTPPVAARQKQPARSESALMQDFAGFAEELGVDPGLITKRARLREDLEMDSLDLVELIMMIEDRYSIEISDEDAQRIETVGDGIEFLKQVLR